MQTCPRCGKPVIQTGVGRPRRWCSAQCRRAVGKQRWRIKKIKRAYATSDAEMIALVQAMAVEPASDRQFAAQPTLDQVLG